MIDGTVQVRFHNPSIRAFVLGWLAHDQSLLIDLIDSAAFFEQVRSIYQFANGYRAASGTKEPFAEALATALTHARQNASDAWMNLIDSPTPERGGKYLADRTTPVTSWFEDRMLFLIALSPELRPTTTWLVEEIVEATARWKRHEGHKQRASSLLDSIERGTELSLSQDTVKVAAGALDEWLATDLEETEEDWVPYLLRLERLQGDAYLTDADLTEKFEQHALNELDRWSPSPPDLGELIDYARLFDLQDLVEVLEERDYQDQEPDGEAEWGWRRAGQQSSPDAPNVTDKELGQMFARLAPGSAG